MINILSRITAAACNACCDFETFFSCHSQNIGRPYFHIFGSIWQRCDWPCDLFNSQTITCTAKECTVQSWKGLKQHKWQLKDRTDQRTVILCQSCHTFLVTVCVDMRDVCVHLSSADLFHTADRLKVDVVVFARREWGVPVAVVRLVVSNSKRQRFWEIPGRELRREVIRQPGAGGVLIGHRLTVTLPAAGLPPCTVWVYLPHDNLIGTVDDGQNMTAYQNFSLFSLSNIIIHRKSKRHRFLYKIIHLSSC